MTVVRRPPRPTIERHPLSAIFGTYVDTPKFKELIESMAKVGQLQPILLLDGKIIDGWHRYLACLELGREPRFAEFEGDEAAAVASVVGLNVARRQLSQSQVAMSAARLHLMTEQNSGRGPTAAALCKQFRVGESVLRYSTRVLRHGSPGIVALVESGALSSKAVEKLVTVTPLVKQEALAKGGRDMVRAAMIELREKDRLAKTGGLSAPRPKAPVEPPQAPPDHLSHIVNDLKAVAARVRAMSGTPEGARFRQFVDQLGLRWFDGGDFTGLDRVWRLLSVACDLRARPSLENLRQMVRE